MKRNTLPPEGWQPGYNCNPPNPNACYCYTDCMYDGNRWRIGSISTKADTVHLYRDMSITGRTSITVAQHRVTSVEWHESQDCEHSRIRSIANRLSGVSQQEGDVESA